MKHAALAKPEAKLLLSIAKASETCIDELREVYLDVVAADKKVTSRYCSTQQVILWNMLESLRKTSEWSHALIEHYI